MDINSLINEKVQRLQDLQKQMASLAQQVGTLQEQGRALHMAAVELKGAIDGLAELKVGEESKLAESKTAQLILPHAGQPGARASAVTTLEVK